MKMRKMSSLMLLVLMIMLVLIIIFKSSIVVPIFSKSDPDPSTYFSFVQQWPASFCRSNFSGMLQGCCFPPTGKPSNFSIHGLWPKENWPNLPKFNFSKIANLEKQLEKHWWSLRCSHYNCQREWAKHGTCSNQSLNCSNHEFWKHEWEKHGSPNFDQHWYFEQALKLKNLIDLRGALGRAGIQPRVRPHKLSDIREAIKKYGGTKTIPKLTCNRDYLNKVQLYEVHVCVQSIAASNFTDCKGGDKDCKCPDGDKDCKNGYVLFPFFAPVREDDLEAHDELHGDDEEAHDELR